MGDDPFASMTPLTAREWLMPRAGAPPVRPIRLKTWHLLVLMVPLSLFCSLMPMVRAARKAAREVQCRINLEECVILLNEIRDRTGRYPPAVTPGPDGKPMHSWRAYLASSAQRPAVAGYDFLQPWSSPVNLKAAAVAPREFVCPNTQAEPPRFANFVAVTDHGVSTFDRANTIPARSAPASKQILLIEYPNSDILWTEPRDLDVTELDKLTQGAETQGLAVIFADRTVRRLPLAAVLKAFGR